MDRFSLEIGPDGAVYVLDWHDGDICGTRSCTGDRTPLPDAPTTSLAQTWEGRYSDLRKMTIASSSICKRTADM